MSSESRREAALTLTTTFEAKLQSQWSTIIAMNIDLKGKSAIVTASSKGIGFGIANALLKSGANVAICGRNPEGVDTALKELGEPETGSVFGLAGDISDAAFARRFVEHVQERFRAIDILVNNSGGPPPSPVLNLTEDQWMSALSNNLMSTIRMCSLVVPIMLQNGWGRIVNLTSTAAKEPAAGMALSNVTRAGVAAYSKTLAQEVGEFGVTVNTILTGGVMTDRLRSLVSRTLEEKGETFDEAIARIGKTIPVRHLATPDEFAQTILYLVSPEASYLTGVAIPVDGGTSKGVF